MTEEEWSVCDNPGWMLTHLGTCASQRKLRLFAAACCGQIWHLLTDKRSKAALKVAERFADGLATQEELAQAFNNAGAALHQRYEFAYRKANHGLNSWESKPGPADRRAAAFASEATVATKAASLIAALNSDALADIPNLAFRALQRVSQMGNPGSDVFRTQAFRTAIESKQADLIRDIFGNPFSSLNCNPTWSNETVVSRAKAIYTDRSFEKMPILADALEDAGCDNADILSHCRSGQDHVRGCWALDLVLRKE